MPTRIARRGFPIPDADLVRARDAAQRAGQSLNAFVLVAIRRAIDTPAAPPAPADALLMHRIADLLTRVEQRMELTPRANPPPADTLDGLDDLRLS